MNKKLGLAVLTAMIGTSVAYANPDPKKIYPWVPIPKEQITSKLKYLAEDNKPITNIRVYDLEESLVASGYAMIEEYDAKGVYERSEKGMDAFLRFVSYVNE